MTSYIHLFLKTELTCIPKFLEKCLGNYYNNTLCNTATWVFLLWCFLHTVFDTMLEGLFKKMKYKQFVRIRLKKALWDLGFFSTALLYTGASLLRNGVELFKFRALQIRPDNSVSSQLILGFIFLSTYFVHSSLWEGLKYNNMLGLNTQILLALFMLFAYFMTIVEISFTVIAVISIVQIIVNVTICIHMLTSYKNAVYQYFSKFILAVSSLAIILGYIILIPLIAVVPLALMIISKVPSFILLTTFLLIVGHITSELYGSPLRRLIDHWLDCHSEDCDVMECVLYAPRNDEAYNLALMRAEIAMRKNSLKTSGKGKLYQTLKCMIAIKRKIQAKRSNPENEPGVLPSTGEIKNTSVEPSSDEESTDTAEEPNDKHVEAEKLHDSPTVDAKVDRNVPLKEPLTEQKNPDIVKSNTVKFVDGDDKEIEKNKDSVIRKPNTVHFSEGDDKQLKQSNDSETSTSNTVEFSVHDQEEIDENDEEVVLKSVLFDTDGISGTSLQSSQN